MASGDLAVAPHYKALRTSLSVMMFLQFFIWGAWFELNFGYLPNGLGFEPWQQALILGAFNVGSVVALFVGTQFVDRYYSAERYLAFSHLVGGLAIGGLFFIQKGMTAEIAGTTIDVSFWSFFLLMLIHSLFYVPTISITNAIAFTHLKDPQREFGLVRVWGTVGWIVASWPFIFILVNWGKVPEFGSVSFVDWLGTALSKDAAKTGDDFRHASRYIFLVAGIASLLLSVYSLGLPHTPPKPAGVGGEKLAWLEAMKLLRKPFVLVLFVVTFLDAAVHQSFFYWTERFLTGKVGIPSNWASPVMKIGQVAEVLTMIFLGYVLKHLGWRFTMILGVLGHAARFAVFAYFPETVPAVLVNVVHGICYAFFFATVYIFIDEFFPKDIRSSAQGLFNLLILGVGPFVANFVCGWLGGRFATEWNDKGVPTQFDFRPIFEVSMGAALAAALLLLLFFHPPSKKDLEKPGLPFDAEDPWRKAQADKQAIQPELPEKIQPPATDIT
jgi:nucleoside transporter